MSNYLRTRLHFLVGLVGGLVSFFGIFILASGIMIKNIIGQEKTEYFWSPKPVTCQYWAGIPTILTGGVLILTAFLNKHQTWKYISFVCILVTMVLAQGVIMEETYSASYVHDVVHNEKSRCHDDTDFLDDSDVRRSKDCDRFKKADPWYYILLFLTDIVFVLCCFVMMLLFADWILFVAPELSDREQAMSVTCSQALRHCEECRTRMCSPQVQGQVLSAASNPALHYSDECRARTSSPQAQEQVCLPLQTR